MVAVSRQDDGRWIVQLDDPAVRAEGESLNATIGRALELAAGALAAGDLRRTAAVLADLLEAIEDELDVLDAERALAEGGEPIPIEDIKARLGM